MKFTKYLKIVIFCVVGILFSFTIRNNNFRPAGGICIIVNADNPVSGMSESEAKLYYLRKVKKRWPTINKNIMPADRKSGCPERDLFYSKVLGMDAGAVEKYFSQREYENAEPNRKKLGSDAEMVQFVADNAGAIGFCSASSAKAPGVKVVATVN